MSKIKGVIEKNGWLLPAIIFGLFWFFIVITSHNESVETAGPTTTPALSQDSKITSSVPQSDVKVELYHFHFTQQCYSCITVGALAEKTVNTYFKDKLDSGELVFSHVNIGLPENRELVMKYEVTGQSLWIGTYVDGKFYKEQNINVWYKINNEQDYLEYLKGILKKRLSGDLG